MSMNHSAFAVDLATPADVAGIVDLQERNLPHNGGRLSVRLAAEWFEAAIADMPVIVARERGHVVGYAVSTPLSAQAHIPIVQAMFRVHPGPPGAYIYGPICVAESHRRRGVAMAMIAELRRRLPGREGFTFIRRDNAVSRTVHARMGMREVAEFTQADIAYVVVAYSA